MIVLLLSPGLAIGSTVVSSVIKKVSQKPDKPPRLVSTIQFDPTDNSKFTADLPISEQCRFATLQIASPASQSQDEVPVGLDKSSCRIVWIMDGPICDEDSVAVASLQTVCSREFCAKALIALHLSEFHTNEVLQYCFAQSFILDQFLNDDSESFMDIVAFGNSAEHGKFFVTATLGKESLKLDPALLLSSQKGWSLTNIAEIDSTAIFPMSLFSPPMTIRFASSSLTTGLYFCHLTRHGWFALLRVVDKDTILLQIAPQVFGSVCDRIAKAAVKAGNTVQTQRPLTPPITQGPSNHAHLRLRNANSFTDHTISLAGWTASQDCSNSSPRVSDRHQSGNEELKEENKKVLKKLLLLSLRHVGVEKSHPEFMSIWKHLYCGCLFALRRDLSLERIDQATMLSVIKNNMNFLNVSR